MVRWILVRHGAHLRGWFGAHGREQVDRLREALERREVRPSLYLISRRPQAIETYLRLVGTGVLRARRESSAALTPEDPSAGLDALVCSTTADLEREPTVVLIGHEGRLSNLLTELTRARHRPFPEAGAVCVTANCVQDLLRGKGEIEFSVPVVDHQEAELRAKVDSKKTVAALLAGFVLTALVATLVEGTKPADRDFSDHLAIVAFATSLAFFIAAVYVYDLLAMPEGFWTDGSRSRLRRRLAGRATRRHEERWNHAVDRAGRSGREEPWLVQQREREARSRKNGPVFPAMVSAWTGLFTPGVLAALVGFAGLLWDASHVVQVLTVVGALFAGGAYLLRRPDLGAD